MSKSSLISGAILITTQLLIAGNVSAQESPMVISSGFGMMPDFYSDEIVKNAPVTARISTRVVQELCDGNRIVHEDSTLLYRDSGGRVRREISTGAAGDPGLISLSDPVEKQTFMLDTANKVAFKVPAFGDIVSGGRGTFGAIQIGNPDFEVGIGAAESEQSGALIIDSGGVMIGGGVPAEMNLPDVEPGVTIAGVVGGPVWANDGQTEVESLGQDTINGVRVEGTSYTTTYSADSFGNEKPIVVEKKTWYAPELRMMVRSEESDPRLGSVTYELEILDTDEPDSSLFEIPPDFKLLDPGKVDRTAPVE